MGVVSGDNSLFFATAIDNSGLQRGKLDAVNIIQSMASGISKINPFAALAVAAVGAFTIIANEGYKMAESFESAMAEVKTIANVSEKEFSKLQKNVFDIYKRLGTEPPDKLANGLYEIIGAGFEAGDALNILEIASKSATAGVTETAVAADGLTTILNAFKLTTQDAQEVADIMFATVDRGKISFEELSSQIATVAPLAASSNISFQEIGAAISTLTKQGVPASVAMTQIRSAVIAANEVLGDGAFKTLSLQEGLQKLFEQADGSQNKLKELAGRIEAVNAIIGIAGPNMQGAADDLEAMKDAAGSVDRSFKTITSTNANQWEIFSNRIKATTKGVGDAVLDMSNDIAGALNGLFDDTLADSEKLKKSFDDQRLKVFELKTQLGRLNEESDERKKLIQDIIKEYPEFLKGVDAEKVTNTELLGILDKVNEAYKTRYKFAQRQQDFQKELEKQGNIEIKIEDVQSEINDQLSKIQQVADNKGLKINIDYSLPNEEIFKDVRKQIDEGEKSLGITAIKGLGTGTGFSKLGQQLFYLVENEKKLNKELITQTSIVDEILQKNEKALKLDLKRAEGREEAIRRINAASKEQDISQFKDSGFEDVETAYKNRIKIITDLEKIGNVTAEQYKSNKNILKDYLASENKEIKEAAKKREAFFNFKPNPSGSSDDDRTDIERFEDDLKERKKQYDSYNNYVAQLGKEAADKEFETLLKQGANFTEYLRSQLKEFQENEAKKKAIVDTASQNNLNLKPREIQKAVSALKPNPTVEDVKIDTTSINAIERQIKQLEEKRKAAITQSERDILQAKIDAKRKELDIANRAVNEEQNLYENLTRSLGDLNNKALRAYIKYWQKKLKVAKKGSKEAAEAESNIQSAGEQIGNNISGTFQEVSGVLSEASSLFKKFGDEDMGQLLDQLAGVAQGAGDIAKGIASGNPLDIISGGLKVLNSAITVEIDSDTPKFEAAIKDLEKAIDKLDYVISQSVGKDRVTGRKQAIEDLKDLEEQTKLATEAELAARKEVKFLGVRIGKKGKGSGTDPAKLEEFEQKAEDARRKAQELREQLDELYTGTTEQTIVDSIISGLKEGKRSVADFADDFKDLMQDALLQAFQIKYLEKEIEKFYDAFADAGSDSNYTAEEIESLRNLYAQMINGAESDLDAINQILEESGIGALGSDDSSRKGLSGAISTITEDTANILAGTLNSIRIDVSNGIQIAQQSSLYLSEIVQNTTYNRYLESIDIKMSNIETAISQFESKGLTG
ncbi:phage tail tape measure protein [Changchengzhania lutea]|uniref:phage tail tape measure protein n=1 Tax=Changchengzhania lutea TaxID=2049305 RepID=UPI00115E7B02|nr:phage tail tape measure protein [Changchengzhania lutea]